MIMRALQVASDVREGRRSAREVVQEALDAVAARDGEFNAFLHVLTDEALTRADEVDAEVARIAHEKLHPHDCDLVVCRKEGATRFLIKVRSTGKEYDLIKSFFHSDNGLNLQTEA